MGSIFLVMYYVTISICLTRISVKRFFIKGHNTTDNIKKRRFIRTAFQKNHQKKRGEPLFSVRKHTFFLPVKQPVLQDRRKSIFPWGSRR